MRAKWLWQGRPWEAFKTFAILFSFGMNLFLLVLLLLGAPLVLPTLKGLALPLVSGLNQSFSAMQQARLEHTFEVQQNVPVKFELPLQAATSLTLTGDVPLQIPAQFILPDGGGAVNGVVQLQLPQGLALPVALEMNVPVSHTIPVDLAVQVDIPVAETQLDEPFAELQELLKPLDQMLESMPASNEEFFRRVRETAPEQAAPSLGMPEDED